MLLWLYMSHPTSLVNYPGTAPVLLKYFGACIDNNRLCYVYQFIIIYFTDINSKFLLYSKTKILFSMSFLSIFSIYLRETSFRYSRKKLIYQSRYLIQHNSPHLIVTFLFLGTLQSLICICTCRFKTTVHYSFVVHSLK